MPRWIAVRGKGKSALAAVRTRQPAKKKPVPVTVAAALSIFVASPSARAADSPTDKSASSGEHLGDGMHAGEGEATEAGGNPDDSLVYDRGRGERAATSKSWQIRGSIEYHHLINASYTNGFATAGAPEESNALNQNLLYYLLAAYWEPTPKDRIWAEGGFYTRAGSIKDSGESVVGGPNAGGLDDALIAYTRTVPLPLKITLRITPRVDIGLSYESRVLEGLIAAPRLGVSLERDFGPINVFVETHGYWYGQQYAEYAGGNPTLEWSLHGLVEVIATMPFHKQLSLGVLATASAAWYHNATDGGSGPLSTVVMNGAESGPSQPIQNTYGGELYVRYMLPTFHSLASDIVVAYADGDPFIGYNQFLHDGVGRFDPFYRSVSEFYTALTARY
jgi:hypothetical protein